MRSSTTVRVLVLALVMALGMTGTALAQPDDALTANGRTVQNLQVEGDGSQFTGRIVNLDVTDIQPDDDGNLQAIASGRLIGTLTDPDGTTQRVNQVFQNVPLQILDQDGNVVDDNLLDPNNAACPILFLELGPIFLDLLGLVVEVPDPIVLEIRAEPGPGQLLGNLLCALLGILDPNGGLV